MKRSTRRLIILLAMLPVAILLLGMFYMWGMSHLEGVPHGLAESLEWAAETLTTTGYGKDNQWHHPAMLLFVIVAQFAGLFLVFMIFPIYVLPYFEERFESRLPRELPSLDKHVLIYRFGPSVDSLIEELRRFGCESVVIEEDEALARRLREQGHHVVLANLIGGYLDLGNIQQARAIVANGGDHDNAVLIALARSQGYRGAIYAFSEDPLHRTAMLRAGASAVFTPRHVLAADLASKVSNRIKPHIAGARQISEHVGVSELRIHADSPLSGQTLGEARVRERIGATVIAEWVNGRFVAGSNRNTRIHPGAIIVAIGSHAALERLGQLAKPLRDVGPIIIAGYGEVGRKVGELLRDAGEQVRVLNDKPGTGVDVVGNVMRQATLEQAGVREASAVILSLGNDSETLFAAAVVREYAPEVPLIARVNIPKSVDLLYRLGADFVLSVSEVAGQMLAHTLLGEEYVSVEPRLKIVKVNPAGMIGEHPWRTGLRDRTGCHMVAVERKGKVHVEFADDFKIGQDDVLYLCGTPEALNDFFTQSPESRPEGVNESDITEDDGINSSDDGTANRQGTGKQGQ